MLASGFVRLAPYLISPRIGQPKAENCARI